MLTKKGKYGLKAAVHLARLAPGASTQVADIAETNQIPKKFLDVILGELRNAGFLTSKKGKLGGYRLARAPEDIIVGEMIRALDGPLAPLPCASRNAYEPCEDCNLSRCEVRLLMVRVRDAIGTVLDTCTLAEMRDLSQDELASFIDYI
ncbi:RrF2 family transcriptional regulator [Xanthobacter tagetidis]|jgi:Rrf2 family protein|uniref:Rrf2 family transcriptional regulator n=1 Tax=Xanthobacter tagetidis TaxID=60216 RepID=A0A3L7AJC8_9HYPH|nr:Rrf2 family transcriptional regulator [Xanthobacter tagetidis]MBB6306448.1 Rrf2 family protein [Xanthobacter tagetidis]RLP79701.1 Rrf2 family transcriptional regulator [Xanthobacter tagetidis]